ncbi:MAG TPA: Ig-like domain-containing protein, partial [Desertimonas sp.]|nr:Ig-like domain-containing protein [Desertimonas sp.]
GNFTPELLDQDFDEQLAEWSAKYTSVPPPTSNRTHCIAWSDWATHPKVELDHGVRLDTNYYYWPESWIQNRPGLMTGSAMPMRFADLDGTMIDVYQAATQMTDESGQSYPFTIDALLDKAIGSQGYYGAYVANMHTDHASHPGSDAIVASALARDVPVVSGSQLLEWVDGRNASSFDSISWSGNELSFTIEVGAGANGLRAMVPTSSDVGELTGVTRNGTPISTTTETIKGVEYAFFNATTGDYEATYAVDETGPVISNVSAIADGDGTATITWNTDEPSDSRVDYGTNSDELSQSRSSTALVTAHSVELNGLQPNATYHYRVTSEDEAGNSATEPPGGAPLSFSTPSASLTDTTVADFSAGAPGADTYVSETANGEVMLRPAVGAEFAGGPALPAGWSGATWESQGGGAGGTAAVSGGSLHVNGAFASTDTTFGPGSSLEGVATFGAATFQHVALTDNFESVWAMFSTRGTTNQLFASTQFGSGVTDTPIPGSLVGSSHRYRIEWDLTEVRYFVDGSLVATHTGTFGPALRAAASDFTAGGPELAVDWMRVGPYPASGAFESRIFDAGQAVNWNQLSWIENTPAGTDIQLSVRTGNTPTPDGSWSSFAPIATSGGSIGGNSRYLQYRAELSTTDPSRTPELTEVTGTYAEDVVPPDPPEITDSDPDSPANDNAPEIKGTAEAGSTVRLYQSGDCSGPVEASDTAAAFASPGLPASVDPDQTVTFTATASDAGNTSACSAPFTYTEDSTAPQTTIDTGPSGTSSNNDPSFSYSSDEPGSSFECRLDGPGPTTGSFADCTPSPKAYTDLADGAYTFSVRATDAAGNVDASPDTRSFSVETTVDNPPVAVSDTATVAEDAGATSINVRANDTDIDGGPKTVLSATQPAHGAVVITGGGTELTYQPNANYCNGGSPTDNFTYTLNGGSTANVSVTVTCVDDAPVAVNDTATVSRNSGPNAINVRANDTDIDAGPKRVQSITQPANGTVAITGGGSGLTYQPNPNYCNGG